MAFTPAQEKALLALLGEKAITLSELSAAATVNPNDLILIRQHLTDKSITPTVLKNHIAPAASLTQVGSTLLNNAINSDNETSAATPKALKNALATTLQKNSNLQDLPDKSTARKHLGVVAASLTQEGLVTLSNSINSNDETTAATSKALNELRNTLSHQLPIGAPIPWPTAIPPIGWLKCNGGNFNKIDFPLLAQAYPSGTLPDLRGQFIRGWDDGRGLDTNRTLLSAQQHLLAAHKHIGGWGETYYGIFGNTLNDGYLGSRSTDSDNFLYWTNDGLPFDGDPNPSGIVGHETRPQNIAFNYIVRAA